MLDDEKQATLAKVLGWLGSEDPGTRAAAGAAVDRFVREHLGLSWAEVAATISIAASLRVQKPAPTQKPAPHPDTDWRVFFDDQCQMGFGRHLRGHIVSTKIQFDGGSGTWTAAVDGCVLRDANGHPQLFQDHHTAIKLLEALVMEDPHK